jgi:hypothetical protein
MCVLSPLLSERFENAAFPPTGWTAYDLDGDSSGTQWQRTTAEAHSDVASALHAFDSGASAEDGWLETPQITLPTGFICVLSHSPTALWPCPPIYAILWTRGLRAERRLD